MTNKRLILICLTTVLEAFLIAANNDKTSLPPVSGAQDTDKNATFNSAINIQIAQDFDWEQREVCMFIV